MRFPRVFFPLVSCLLTAWCMSAAAQSPTLVSISVTPSSPSIPSGSTQQFTATGKYSDSSTQNLTLSATWSSSNASSAIVGSSGVATGLLPGAATISATVGSIAGSTGTTVVDTNLAGWWRFNDGSGSSALDSSGNGNSASLVNGVPWVTGQLGDAISANGTNQYAQIPAVNLGSTSAITWTLWINRTWTSAATTLFENSANFNSSTTGFGFFPDDSTDCGIANTMMTGVHGNVGYTLSCYKQPTSGAWHHLAVVYDKTQSGANVISLYIDGVLQTPASQPYTATNTNPFGDDVTYVFSRGGASQFAAGEMEDLRLYNQALTAAQVEQIYLQGLGTLTAIAVTPANTSVAQGGTQQMTAMGTYSNGSPQSLTSLATWSSSNTAIVTVNATGLAKGVTAGSSTLAAAYGAISGSTALTVNPPTLQSITVTPVNQILATGSTLQFTAMGTYSDGSTQNLTSSVTWSSSITADATINSSGLATAVARGNTTIQATSGSISGNTGLEIVTAGATLTSISVTPASFSLLPGATQQLTATGTYSDQSTQNLTSSVTWSSSSTATATVNSSGLVTAVAAGSANIQATSGSISGSAQASVLSAASLAGWWTFNQGSGTTVPDSSGNGNTATLVNGVSWVTGQIGEAISTNGTNQYVSIPAVNLGSTAAITWTAWVNRTWTSASTTLLENTTNFNASATGFGFFPDDSADCGIANTMMTGVHGNVGYTLSCYKQPSSGVWHHLAVTYDKSQAGASVIALYIDGVLQTPVSQPYTATNTNDFGSNPTYVFSRGGTGEYTAGEMDDLRVYSQALTAAQIQQVYQQGLGTLQSITVTPANATVGIGNTQQYAATGTYSSGISIPLTSAVAWSSSNTSIATINSSGLATGVVAGSTTIEAIAGTATGSTGLTVTTGPTLVSIAVTPSSFSLTPGGTQQLTATGTYSNQTQQNLTSSVTWSSSNTAAATVNSSGLVTGVAASNATIQATSGSINGTAQVSVLSASSLVGWWTFNQDSGTTVPDSSGNGDTATLENGVTWVTGQDGYAISANGTNQYVSIPAVNLASTQAITWTAWLNRTWTSASTVLLENSTNFNSTTTGFGFFPDDSTDCGTAGTMMTGVHGNIGYTLNCYAQPTSGVWHHLAVVYDKSQAGANVISLYIDGLLQSPVRQPYTATNTNDFGDNPTFLFSRGGTSEFTASEMDDLRLYDQALTAAQIQQIYQQGLGTLESITVTPANATVNGGNSQQYTATGNFNTGATANMTNFVTWSSGNTAVASVSSSGLVTATSAGSTTIKATSGTVSGSTGLTVNAGPTLVSIAVAPSSFTLVAGDTQQLTATGTYSDSSTQNLSNSVTWSSSNTADATVNSTGLVSGVAAGSAVLQASFEGLSGSAQGTILGVSSLVGWWKFDDGSGTSAADFSGNGNNATLVNGVSWVTGQIGEAISTNGTNQYVSIPAVNLGSTAAITWTAWVNRTWTSASTTLLENTTNFNASATGFGFFPDDSADCGIANTMMTGVHGNVGYTLSCYKQPSSGVWHHLAVTYDKSQAGASVISLYIDGVLQAPVSQPYTATNTNDFGSNPTYVFSRGGTGEYTAGEMDDLRFYSQALSAAQIQQVYQQGLGTLQSITVTPANATVGVSGTMQYSAEGTYSGGAMANISNSVTWSSTNTTAATISASGLAKGAATGTTTIKATSGSVSGSTGLTVTQATLQSIVITPGNQAISLGGTQQYTATGVYTDGSMQNLTSLVAWLSTNPSAATITSAGLASGVAKGTSTITATLGTTSGSTPLTVTAVGATLQSISVSPSSISVLPAQTLQITATGTYSDGSTQNLTSWATWTSSNTAVATISSTGLLTAIAPGSTTISAGYQSVAGMGSIVVVPVVGQFVQFTSSDAGSTTSSVSLQDQKSTSGNLILAFSHWNNAAATATAQDQLGNTYTPIFQQTCVGGTDCFQVWYAKNIKGGSPLAVAVTYSQKTTSISTVDVIEYAGLDTSNPLDVIASATGSGTLQSSGTMPTTTSPVETIVGLFGYQNYDLPYMAGSGFTFRNYDASTMLEDKAVSSIGTYSATATSTVSGNWAAFAIGFRNELPVPPGLVLSPPTVSAGSPSSGTVVLNAPAPTGGTLVTIASAAPAVASVPASVTVPAGATSASFPITTSPVIFTTAVPVYVTVGSVQEAALNVVPQSMASVATDSFNRANATTLGPNWTPLEGSVDVPMQIVNGQIESANPSSLAKEMYYGGLNWTPDQYSQVQIITAAGEGNEGPALRMSSNDTHYACLVTSLGAGNASVSIVLDYQTSYTTLASSTTATVTAGDVIRCTVQGTLLTMTDITSSATLLTATDATIPAGYPGVVDYAGGTGANYVMANWSAGASAQPLTATQFAADSFNRANALSLGSNWVVGSGHGPIQIVNDQIQPYPAGGVQPSKQHYIAYGPFPNDQWSQFQLVFEDTVGDIAAEIRASDVADNMYVCDVNLTGAPGTAEARIVKVVNGTIITLVIDQQWSTVSPGDYIRGQVQGPLISLIDVTTGALLLTTYDTTYASGYPGISMQADTGQPSDHIAANWSGGGFQ